MIMDGWTPLIAIRWLLSTGGIAFDQQLADGGDRKSPSLPSYYLLDLMQAPWVSP